MPDGSYLLIIVDEYSRFPVVEIIHSTSADTVIAAFERVFAMLGNIEVLKTDMDRHGHLTDGRNMLLTEDLSIVV